MAKVIKKQNLQRKSPQKLPHIFWILTDGTRYKKGEDKYGRPPVYYEFDKESIYFKKVITTAPSTLMSVSSMLTGRFSAELYPHFKYINKLGLVYPNYIQELKKKGYAVNSSIFCSGAGRLLFKDLLGSTGKESPADVKSGMDGWTEFEKIMKEKFDWNKPNIVFIHLGWFWDNNEAVIEIFDYLKKNDLWNESFVITCSDHGYVDYGKFKYLGWALQPRTHSLYLDENSYRANLNIKTPKSFSRIKQKDIGTPVNLVDIWETIFDYLGLKYNCENKKALSLRGLIEKEDPELKNQFKKRITRVDNRYAFQNYRATRLINDSETYLITSSEEVDKLPDNFKIAYKQMEKEELQTSLELVDKKYVKSELSKLKGKRIAIYYYNHKEFISHIYNNLKKKNVVSILDLKSIKSDYRYYDVMIAFVDNPYFEMYHSLVKFCRNKNIDLELYDNYFDKVEYSRYRYMKETYNDPGMKSDHHKIVKFGLYFILLYLKLEETRQLKYIKDNYHPVVKNI